MTAQGDCAPLNPLGKRIGRVENIEFMTHYFKPTDDPEKLCIILGVILETKLRCYFGNTIIISTGANSKMRARGIARS